MDSCRDIEEYFYGSATIGERGQIVIPAEARKDCEIHTGDKLLVFRHPMHPKMLILGSVTEMQQMHQQLIRAMEQLSQRIEDELSEKPASTATDNTGAQR
jgi:AbrB family looped-hinge helix DNA binding protein